MAIAHLLLKFDGHWLTIVGTALWFHLSRVCLVGFCYDKLIQDFVPTISSTIFVFTVASFLAEFQIAGPLKKCPYMLKLLLEVLIVLILMNVALRIYWIPFLMNTQTVLKYVANSMLTSRFRTLQQWHKWFAGNVNYESANESFNIFVALALFSLYVYVAEIVEFVCDMYVIEKPGMKKKHGKSKKMQENTDTKNLHDVNVMDDEIGSRNK